MDMYSAEDVTIAPGETYGVGTGWAFEFPGNYVVRALGRSGLALKKSIALLGGVIDSSYRGEWKMILHNHGKEPWVITKGDKIAQAVFFPFAQAELLEVNELAESRRGDGGFGSSDQKQS